MISCIIIIIGQVMGIPSLIVYWNERNTTEFKFGAITVSLSIIFALLLIFSHPKQIDSIDKYELVAIRGDSQINGQFFLGSGYIDEEEYYIYYKKLNNGGFKQDKVLSSLCTIFEDTVDKGELITYKHDFDSLSMVFYPVSRATDSIEIHIPPNSITRSFKLE